MFQQTLQLNLDGWADDMALVALNYKKRMTTKQVIEILDGDVGELFSLTTADRALRGV
jgi:hypothetical protein